MLSLARSIAEFAPREPAADHYNTERPFRILDAVSQRGKLKLVNNGCSYTVKGCSILLVIISNVTMTLLFTFLKVLIL